jgi:hypothetical protein
MVEHAQSPSIDPTAAKSKRNLKQKKEGKEGGREGGKKRRREEGEKREKCFSEKL